MIISKKHKKAKELLDLAIQLKLIENYHLIFKGDCEKYVINDNTENRKVFTVNYTLIYLRGLLDSYNKLTTNETIHTFTNK